MSLHRCPAIGCDRRIQGHEMFCLPHWKTLPGPMKVALLREWRQDRGGPGYAAAMDAAIAALGTSVPAKGRRTR
jgi:hypothetical protein